MQVLKTEGLSKNGEYFAVNEVSMIINEARYLRLCW